MRRCWKTKYLQTGRVSPPDLGSGALFMCIGAMCGREDDRPAPAAAVAPKAGAVLLSLMIFNTGHQPPAAKPHIIARCAVPAAVQTAVRPAPGTSFYSLSARRSPAFFTSRPPTRAGFGRHSTPVAAAMQISPPVKALPVRLVSCRRTPKICLKSDATAQHNMQIAPNKRNLWHRYTVFLYKLLPPIYGQNAWFRCNIET